MATETEKPTALSLALLYLRSLFGPRPAAADLMRISAALLGRYEGGKQKLSRDQLEDLAGRIGHPPEAVDLLLFTHELVAPPPPEEAASPVALTAGEHRRILRTVMTYAWTLVRELRTALIRKKKQDKADQAHREAGEAWKTLMAAPTKDRRDLVRTFPEYRSWALAMKVCHESARKAVHSAKEALELAELALFIAEQFRGDARFRAALQAYCWVYVGNARRVGNDFDGADVAFARSADLRREGADPDGLLPERRMLDLEASLRREQHRFAEALALLECALERTDGSAANKARILLKKEHVLNQMGDLRGALATLSEAAPWVKASNDPHLLFTLQFNRAETLGRLELYAELAELLPSVRRLAEQQRNELSLVRLVWLEAKAMAGQGQKQEAILRLEQVQRDFTFHELPYDAALSSLDLAVLWLEAGRTREVQQLAVGLKWIFLHQKIAEKALAALKLFCDAAKQDAATVELARQVIVDIEQVRRAASRSEDAPGGRA